MRKARAKAKRRPGRTLARTLLGLAGLCAFALAAAQAGEAKPKRIVSLNLCTDQLLLALAEPQNIAALSFLATDPDLSYYADAAKAFPQVRGAADEVVVLEPDLVLAQEHSARVAVSLLRELGYPVLDLPVAASLDDVRAQIRTLSRVLGEEARGRALIAQMNADLGALAAGAPSARPSALVYGANGYAPARPSLPDDLLAAAGFRNLARGLVRLGGGQLPLETLLAADPDLLVIEQAREGSASLADALLDHPALAARFADSRILRVPAKLWVCGGPFSVEAARLLVLARLRTNPETAP